MNKAMCIVIALALVTMASAGCSGMWGEDAAQLATICATDANSCTNSQCCKAVMCEAMKTTTCGNGKEYDTTKDTTAALTSTYVANCCKTSAAVVVPTTCAGWNSAAKACGNANLYDSANAAVLAAEGTYDANCCKQATCGEFQSVYTCPDERIYDTTKAAVDVPARFFPDSFQDTCCKAAATCGEVATSSCAANKMYDSTTALENFSPGSFSATCCKDTDTCDTHTCTTGYVAKSTPASIFCLAIGCDTATCCDRDTTKCLGQAVSVPCGAAQYMPVANAGKEATSSTFVANCCVAKATCLDYKDHLDGALRTSPAFAVAAVAAIIASLL
jgi:hypothetical protein